ncbi:hypothetical protein Tco_1428348 [Tanacetum coccineum]
MSASASLSSSLLEKSNMLISSKAGIFGSTGSSMLDPLTLYFIYLNTKLDQEKRKRESRKSPTKSLFDAAQASFTLHVEYIRCNTASAKMINGSLRA